MTDYNEKYLKYKNKYLDLKYKFNIYQKGGSRFSYNDNESVILATIESIGKDPNFMTIPERLEEYERIQRLKSSEHRGSGELTRAAAPAGGGGGGGYELARAAAPAGGVPLAQSWFQRQAPGAGAFSSGAGVRAFSSGAGRKDLPECRYYNTPAGCRLGELCPFKHTLHKSLGSSSTLAGGRSSATAGGGASAAAGGGASVAGRSSAAAGGGGGGASASVTTGGRSSAAAGGGASVRVAPEAPGARVSSNWSPYMCPIQKTGETYSSILVPLIYNNLDDVTVIFPGDCDLNTIFAECLTENPKLKESLNLTNFADFNKLIKASLNRNGINSRKNIMESRSDDFKESRFNWHLRGHAQNIILGAYDNLNLYSISIIFAEKIIEKCRDKIIRMSRK